MTTEIISAKAPSTAMAIANWFLEKCWNEPTVPHCDQLKLNKLVYYAQAWYLANFERPLFEEDIEAWPHGPVIRDLYLEFKSFGENGINVLGTRLEFSDENHVENVTPKHDGSLDYFLDVIWERYKKYTGIRLSNATHMVGEPWELVSKNRNLDDKPTIPIDIIQHVFRKKIA